MVNFGDKFKQNVVNYVKEGVKNFKADNANSDLKFYDKSVSGGKFNQEDYEKSVFATSAELLKGYDENADGTVTTEEFGWVLWDENALDMIQYYADNDVIIDDAEKALMGSYASADMISRSLDLDINNEISVEEMATVLQYVDAYGWHKNENGTYQKDSNDLGEISNVALADLFDYLTDGGNQNIKEAQEYRTGRTDFTQEEFHKVKELLSKNVLTMRQQADMLDIDYEANTRYTDFE